MKEPDPVSEATLAVERDEPTLTSTSPGEVLLQDSIATRQILVDTDVECFQELSQYLPMIREGLFPYETLSMMAPCRVAMGVEVELCAQAEMRE